MELDPLYVDTIVRRWQALTGDAARLEPTGERFEAVQASRQAVLATASTASAPEELSHAA